LQRLILLSHQTDLSILVCHALLQLAETSLTPVSLLTLILLGNSDLPVQLFVLSLQPLTNGLEL
jgi:hypothetical protein